MLSPSIAQDHQIPLIHEIHADDHYLLNTIDGEWFEILHHFPWMDYRDHAATYYDALYEFNSEEREAAKGAGESTPETKDEAKQRILFERPTMQLTPAPPAQIIYQGQVVECKAPVTDPQSVAPGVVPTRLVGRKPKGQMGSDTIFVLCFLKHQALKVYRHGPPCSLRHPWPTPAHYPAQ